MKCPWNYDITKCSSNNYGYTCETCFHNNEKGESIKMDKANFVEKYMKRIQLKDISNYKEMPILMVSPKTIEAKKNNLTVAVFDAGYTYDWFVFNGSIPINDKIDTTAFFVLKDW